LSISEKLADYDQTIDLLSRLKKEELQELAERNGIKLEREDLHGKIRRARTKSQIIDILLESEFRESDLIELLGVSRLTKEELLNCMNLRQLKQLAKETGIELVKSSIFGTRKATRKKDIIDALKVLSTSKIREFAEKISLIKKPTKLKRRKPRTSKAKARIKSKKQKKPTARVSPVKKTAKPSEPKPVERKAPSTRRKRKPVSPEISTERMVIQRGRLIEETVKETITKRKIVRRIVLVEASEREITKTLEAFSPSSARREKEYEEQLSELLEKRGLIPEEKAKKRGEFDFVFGEKRIAVELKTARTPRALSRLADKISKHLNQYEKIFAVVIDETGTPEKTKKQIEKIEKINPKKVKVLVKKAKKKKTR